ncbi:hypothetical protein [Confluentibacter sediminis]|uniref:hypothetical protein n=1 Tax=Confluentibacter sediminis TaxID=2219045 RepID=UPI0013A6B2B5|nr:hypothetical protein [Confluentibacter sediminis]
MRKIILITSISAILLTMAFNMSIKIDNTSRDVDLASLISINNASAESPGDNCDQPEWLYGSCNQRKESVITNCNVSVTKTTYYDANGRITGTTITTGGTVTGSAGVGYTHSSSHIENYSFSGTRVNCPTDGGGNDCEEYNPCTT